MFYILLFNHKYTFSQKGPEYVNIMYQYIEI